MQVYVDFLKISLRYNDGVKAQGCAGAFISSEVPILYSSNRGSGSYSWFTIYTEWLLTNIFVTGCRSHMGFSRLNLESKL